MGGNWGQLGLDHRRPQTSMSKKSTRPSIALVKSQAANRTWNKFDAGIFGPPGSKDADQFAVLNSDPARLSSRPDDYRDCPGEGDCRRRLPRSGGGSTPGFDFSGQGPQECIDRHLSARRGFRALWHEIGRTLASFPAMTLKNLS